MIFLTHLSTFKYFLIKLKGGAMDVSNLFTVLAVKIV